MTSKDLINRFMLNVDDVITWKQNNTVTNATPNTRKFTINFRDGANAIAVIHKNDDGSWKLSYKSTRLRWMDDMEKYMIVSMILLILQNVNCFTTIPRTDETNLNWCDSVNQTMMSST